MSMYQAESVSMINREIVSGFVENDSKIQRRGLPKITHFKK